MTILSISIEKEKLRNNIRAARHSLSASERDAQSRRIADILLTHSVFTNARNIFCYISRDDEVSTDRVCQESLKNKKLFVPTIVAQNIIPTPVFSDTQFVPGAFGILEPLGAGKSEVSPKIDLIIMPALAFDRHGNRLGMGKGFYDRYLKLHPTIPTIGLAFDFQLVDKVPTDDYDVPVSFVVTPNEFFTCKPTTSSHS